MASETLTDLFWRTAPSEPWPDYARLDVERALDAAVSRAERSYPALQIPAPDFVRFIAERVPSGADPLALLESLHVEELYLTCACLGGSSVAIAELDRVYVSEAARALARLGLSPAACDEALQHARERLFTSSDNGGPKLQQFSGQGSLAGWVRVVVVRTAMNARRSERRHEPRDDDILASKMASEADDPELATIKERYASVLAGAVAAAFRALSSEQRNLLRMYVIDGLTLAELSRLHAVDASTISRWLTRIRGKLYDETRGHLLERHAMRPSECESLMRVVKSDLGFTLSRLLATEGPTPSSD
jgi:RNA polymerase sigma-70 factor (ECF subfamily)